MAAAPLPTEDAPSGMAQVIADLLTDALAVYRLTRLVTTDLITQPARDAIEAHATKRTDVIPLIGPSRPTVTDVQPWAFLRDVTQCDWCTSMWVAFGVLAARRLAPEVWRPVAEALACSTVAGLIAERS